MKKQIIDPPCDIGSVEWLPTHKETISGVIGNAIGKYYYGNLLGENLNETQILYEDKGHWYWRGHLYALQFLIERFKKIHGGDVRFKEQKLIRTLKKIDKEQGENAGHRVLGVLATLIITQEPYTHNIKFYQRELNKARKIISRMKKEKDKFIKKLARYDQFRSEKVEELNKEIESTIEHSKAMATLTNIPIYYHFGSLPSIPPTSIGRKGRFSTKLGKEKTPLNKGVMELYDVIDPQRKSPVLATAKIISSILDLFATRTSAEAIRKIILRQPS